MYIANFFHLHSLSSCSFAWHEAVHRPPKDAKVRIAELVSLLGEKDATLICQQFEVPF
jgi:hypothetical protein